jgi:hypothetical protein
LVQWLIHYMNIILDISHCLKEYFTYTTFRELVLLPSQGDRLILRSFLYFYYVFRHVFVLCVC